MPKNIPSTKKPYSGKKRGRPFGKVGSVKSTAQKAKVMAMSSAGITQKVIAKKTNMSQGTVSRIVREEDQPEYLKRVREMSVAVAEDALKIVTTKMKEDGWLAFKLLDRIGGLPEQKKQIQLEVRTPEVDVASLSPAEQKEMRIREWMANLARVAYERSIVYEQPLPEMDPALVEGIKKKEDN